MFALHSCAVRAACVAALLLIATASAACPADCPQGSGYSHAQWSCCDVPTDHPLCAGETPCNDDTQSSCCGVALNGNCYRIVRCWGADQCLVDTCGNTESNPRCYAPQNNAVCESQSNGCTVRQLYDPAHTICCGGALYDNVNWACCAGTAYLTSSHECCNGAVVPSGQCTPASASSTRPPAPSASSTRPPAPSASATRPPASCSSSNCQQKRGYAPAGGWSCCDFGSLAYPLCAGEDLCNDASQSSCCGVALNGDCYRVVRCYNGDQCLADNGCTAGAPECYDTAHNSVCSYTDDNGCVERELYDPAHTICCGGELYDNVNWACCQGTPYRPSAQDCCADGSVADNGHC